MCAKKPFWDLFQGPKTAFRRFAPENFFAQGSDPPLSRHRRGLGVRSFNTLPIWVLSKVAALNYWVVWAEYKVGVGFVQGESKPPWGTSGLPPPPWGEVQGRPGAKKKVLCRCFALKDCCYYVLYDFYYLYDFWRYSGREDVCPSALHWVSPGARGREVNSPPPLLPGGEEGLGPPQPSFIIHYPATRGEKVNEGGFKIPDPPGRSHFPRRTSMWVLLTGVFSGIFRDRVSEQ